MNRVALLLCGFFLALMGTACVMVNSTASVGATAFLGNNSGTVQTPQGQSSNGGTNTLGRASSGGGTLSVDPGAVRDALGPTNVLEVLR